MKIKGIDTFVVDAGVDLNGDGDADIGLLGKNVRVGGDTIDAVDVFVGGRSGLHAKPGTKVLEDVPCEDLPFVLERVIPYLTNKRIAHPLNSFPALAPAAGVS